MIKNVYVVVLALFSISLFGQVGINTNQPSQFSSLDIKSDNTGILIPRVTLKSTKDLVTVKFNTQTLSPEENSLLVYNTNTSNIFATNERTDVFDEVEDVFPGFYYWQVDRWIRLSSKNDKQFFYMPSIVIPTHQSQVNNVESLRSISVNNGIIRGSVNLYEVYKNQFGSSMVKNAQCTTSLPLYKKNQLDYYITWYDDKVFENVVVSNDGVLTYNVKATDSTVLGSFMNIVFVVK